MKPIVAIALILAAVPAIATAQDGDRKAEKAPKAKKICRSRRETGSNMAVSTCHSQAEWDAIDSDHSTADALRDLRNSAPH